MEHVADGPSRPGNAHELSSLEPQLAYVPVRRGVDKGRQEPKESVRSRDPAHIAAVHRCIVPLPTSIRAACWWRALRPVLSPLVLWIGRSKRAAAASCGG